MTLVFSRLLTVVTEYNFYFTLKFKKFKKNFWPEVDNKSLIWEYGQSVGGQFVGMGFFCYNTALLCDLGQAETCIVCRQDEVNHQVNYCT